MKKVKLLVIIRETFHIKIGVKKEDGFSSLLFNVAIDNGENKLRDNKLWKQVTLEITLTNLKTPNLKFADDITILKPKTNIQPQEKLKCLKNPQKTRDFKYP